jgi:two-component system nitrogen regulation sensor histidine kinase GlnL
MPSVASLFRGKASTPVSADLLINNLPDPVLVVDQSDRIRFANLAAEQFFQSSAKVLQTQGLTDLIPFDSPLVALIGQVRNRNSSVSEYGLVLSTPRIGVHHVDVQICPVGDEPSLLLVTLRARGIASKIDHQLLHRGAARSIVSMAAVLAHEIKNPLSGIRGAAQLVESVVGSEDKALLRLICEETDRIVALVDRMEVFSDTRPIERTPINIHEVLEHARRVAENGFARNVRFIELYDPSLPPVHGDRNMLIQVFLNLIKNAAEAVAEEGGEITLSTAYRHGVRVAIPGSRERINLPLEISVIDNGGGIPDDLQSHLFDPFVTTKPGGTGLGLALVAKIVGDHGGIIECDSVPRRTVFRVLLPTGPSTKKTRHR